MGLWGILWFLIFLEKSWGHKQTYVISRPKAFHVGTAENITIQAHGYTEAFDVAISIKSFPNPNLSYSLGSVTLSPENRFQNSSVLAIQPEQFSEGQSSASYVYLSVVSRHFSQLKIMPIIYDRESLLTHTDKPVYIANQPDKTHKVIFRPRRDLQQRIQEQVVKKCCYDGAVSSVHETCDQRAARIKTGPRCQTAFKECCMITNQLRTHKVTYMSTPNRQAPDSTAISVNNPSNGEVAVKIGGTKAEDTVKEADRQIRRIV